MQLTEEAPHERHWMQTVYVCLEGKEWGVCKGDSKIGLVRSALLGESEQPVWPPSDWKDDGGRHSGRL